MKKFLMVMFYVLMMLNAVACGNTDSHADVLEQSENKGWYDVLENIVDSADDDADDDGDDEANEEDTLHTDSSVENEVVFAPQFENGTLTVLADQFANAEMTNVYKTMFHGLYVETADGLYHSSDETLSDNLLDKEGLNYWHYSEFTDFFYVDDQGYYHLFLDGEECLAYGIKGEVFYAFDGMLSDVVVYSIDEEGHVYCSEFETSGKMTRDNVLQTFELVERSGWSSRVVATYDKVDSIQVLPAKGSYITGPQVLITVDGRTYFESFSLIIANKVTLDAGSALPEDVTYLDHGQGDMIYTKADVADRVFYLDGSDEYWVNLPDGHTVDEIRYFNRGVNGCQDLLLFDNGDVYLWTSKASILGEDPVKHEELSQLGSEIRQVIFDNPTGYYFVMSDGVIYEMD